MKNWSRCSSHISTVHMTWMTGNLCSNIVSICIYSSQSTDWTEMYRQSHDLLVLTHFKLKYESINSYPCVSHCPWTKYRFQQLKLSLWTFLVINPPLFLSNCELFSGFNLGKCCSYVRDNCKWLNPHSLAVIVAGWFNRVWCDTLRYRPPCWLTLKPNTCRFVILRARYATSELSDRCKASLDTYKGVISISYLPAAHVLLCRNCCIDRIQMLEAGPDGTELLHFLHWFLKDKHQQNSAEWF